MTLAADVPNHLGLHSLFDALHQQGIRVTSLRLATNRLEQLFMDLLEGKSSPEMATSSLS